MSAGLSVPVFDRDGAVLYHGDCLEILPLMAENSIDSIVCDPPYGLEFMQAEWDTFRPGYKKPGFGQPDGSKFRRNRGTPQYTAEGNPTCRNCGGDKYRIGDRKCRCDKPDFGNPARSQMLAFQAWCESWAREAIRVLKPGGHMLCFGGTRTCHRLTCAIEDAGFEIRDRIGCFGWEFASLSWVFGSSMPKGINISIAIDQMECDRREREVRAVLAGLGYPDARWAEEAKPTKGDGGDAGEAEAIDAVPVVLCVEVEVDGRAVGVERLADGTFRRPGYLREAEREVVGSKIGMPGYSLAPGKGRMTLNSAEDGSLNNSDSECAITAPATDAARQFDGWSSQLKSMYEPIILARKPLVGSIVENVLMYGTGGLNVGACRLAAGEGGDREGEASRDSRYTDSGSSNFAMKPGPRGGAAEGRYPTNCLYVHHPLCVPCGERRVKGSNPQGTKGEWADGSTTYDGGFKAKAVAVDRTDADGMETVQEYQCVDGCPVAELDRQGRERGVHGAGHMRPEPGGGSYSKDDQIVYGGGIGVGLKGFRYGDQGSPSRFMPCFTWDASDFVPLRYVSKASRPERESGLLGHVPCATCGDLHSREHRNDQGRMVACVRNIHPTIKPCSLLQWMCKLLCPPGGTILDPFCGTASGGRAAILEGFRYIGIEREPSSPGGPDYIAIAKARLADALLDRERPNRPKPKGRPKSRGKGAARDAAGEMPLFAAMDEDEEREDPTP